MPKATPPPPKKAKVQAKRDKSGAVSSASSTKDKGKQKAVPQTEPSTLPSTFKIVAGSYEKLLYGLEGRVSGDDDMLEFHLKPIFTFPAHVSCIKAVAVSPSGGKWLATGSSDEIIKVWDLRRKKEIGGLMHHEGSITHLSFPSRGHLLSASEDGTLCLFRARDWAVLRSLKGHKGHVNCVAVHPSGKVALSVGKDRTLRMWDLMRGKGSASTKLGKEGEVVRWSISGSLFIVQSGSTIDLYNTEMTLLHTIKHPSRLHDAKFCKRVDSDEEVLLVGAEDKKLTIYDVSNDPEKPPTIIGLMVGHENRVKAVQTLSIALPASKRTATTIVCTASSDGKIHVYDLAALDKTSQKVQEIEPVAVYDSKGTRLTCIAIADGEAAVTNTVIKKRKREDDTGGSEDEDEDAADEWDMQTGETEGEEEEEEDDNGEEDDEDEDEDGESS
ncbi:WD40 repeat-like protein [Guyanagaster necrorhizus]|uniref:WD40 repeat-like protein n=1 Tax=Guyanagaster necrorhizus TaxID=856835 RepID=A0A9P7VR37_9AGAR|nr:WD40 repeat-like protein [Guyanagaster necrorhizus MCA 3950]KAG7445118.1 WD40 repeat-like protein [Guyanagaster necrorhizus MCA 3950]